MAFTSLKYDNCATRKYLDQSTSELDYLLDPIRYENCNKCRMEFGIIAGTDVSQISGNLVELENDLYGLNRSESLCPSKKFQPTKDNKILYDTGRGCSEKRTIDTSMIHLPSCQMIDYKPTPLPPPLVVSQCPYPSIRSVKPSCQSFMPGYKEYQKFPDVKGK